ADDHFFHLCGRRDRCVAGRRELVGSVGAAADAACRVVDGGDQRGDIPVHRFDRRLADRATVLRVFGRHHDRYGDSGGD
nr:hypothetical protein [Tanacetum cinerariifolium]